MKCAWKITGIHKKIEYLSIHFLDIIPNKIKDKAITESEFKIQPLWGNFQENSNLMYLHKNCGWCVIVFQIFMLKKYCLYLLETPEFLMLDWNSDSRSENCRLTWFTRCLKVKHSTIIVFFQNKTPHISMVKMSTYYYILANSHALCMSLTPVD